MTCVAAALLRSALWDERRILTVSRDQEGACGIREVAIPLPPFNSERARGRTRALRPPSYRGCRRPCACARARTLLAPASTCHTALDRHPLRSTFEDRR